jgi:predicted membrane metal-binding protein
MLRGDKVLSFLAGAVLVASALFPAGNFPDLLPCPFKLLTGWPCPGCGLTHAFCDVSHGNLAGAWTANPFGFLFYALALVSLVWPRLVARFPSVGSFVARSRMAYWAPPSLVVIMWVFDIVRIAQG